MRPFFVGMIVAGLLVAHDVGAVQPLDNTEEFLIGAFRMPATPPAQGSVPARLSALPHDGCALAKGTWLRFENFGADRYKGWSAQMQIDAQGNLYLVTNLGDATAEKVKNPSWPARPTQKLDGKTLEELHKAAIAFAAGPSYRGHEGLSYAPTFVIRVATDKGDKEIVLEGYEDDFVARLRRITSFAHSTPLAKAPDKAPAKTKPAPARKP